MLLLKIPANGVALTFGRKRNMTLQTIETLGRVPTRTQQGSAPLSVPRSKI